jgi:hypothetical protein
MKRDSMECETVQNHRRRKHQGWLLLAVPLLLVVGVLWVVYYFACGSLGYRAESADLTTGQQYYYNQVSRQAFAADYHWDGDDAHRTIQIPDTVFGYSVTSLGGYMGRGVPCNFTVRLPDDYIVKEQFEPELFEDVHQQHPNAQVVDLVFPVTLGKNVSSVKVAAPRWFYCFDAEGTACICRVYFSFDCDPENKTYYSQDGKLYTRADGVLVPDFSYPKP